jgi:hypothetical protein
MFADDLELAAYLEEQRTLSAIADALADKPKVLPLVKECHNCGEELEAGLRFCDQFCRDDYEHRTNRRKING